jgi:uncharacterized protein
MKNFYTLSELKSILKEKKEELAETFFVSNIFIFGSYANGTQTEQSDIDLLIETIKPISLFKFVNLKEYFENILGKKIDLGTPDSLKPFVKDKILKEAIQI